MKKLFIFLVSFCVLFSCICSFYSVRVKADDLVYPYHFTTYNTSGFTDNRYEIVYFDRIPTMVKRNSQTVGNTFCYNYFFLMLMLKLYTKLKTALF